MGPKLKHSTRGHDKMLFGRVAEMLPLSVADLAGDCVQQIAFFKFIGRSRRADHSSNASKFWDKGHLCGGQISQQLLGAKNITKEHTAFRGKVENRYSVLDLRTET